MTTNHDRPPPWVETIARGRLCALAGALARDDFEFEASWPETWREALEASGLAGTLTGSPELLDAYQESLRRPQNTLVERSRILLTGGCPAYETTYAHAFSKQQELADISGFYNAFGLVSEGERADHLAVECEFVALVSLKEAIATASGLEEEAARCRDARGEFLADHLGTWLALYRSDLDSRSRLLAAAVDVIRALVQHDAAILGKEVHERERPDPQGSSPEAECPSVPARPA